jgi:hypothetical protein
MSRHLRLPKFFLLTLCLALPGCLSYHARFEKAVATAAGKYEDPTGPWIGNWRSDWNGHEGPLWCIVTETPGQPGSYDFRYRAGWGILQFGNYVHTVTPEKSPEGSLLVKGEMDLPKLVGTHSLDGAVSNLAFDASYKSVKGDHGKMVLRRPQAKPAPPAPALE